MFCSKFSTETTSQINISPCARTLLGSASRVRNFFEHGSTFASDLNVTEEEHCSTVLAQAPSPRSSCESARNQRRRTRTQSCPKFLQIEKMSWVSSQAKEVMKARKSTWVSAQVKEVMKARKTLKKEKKLNKKKSNADEDTCLNESMLPTDSCSQPSPHLIPSNPLPPYLEDVESSLLAPPSEFESLLVPQPAQHSISPQSQNVPHSDDSPQPNIDTSAPATSDAMSGSPSEQSIPKEAESVCYKLFHINGTMETHSHQIPGLVPILEIESQRRVLSSKKRLVMQELDNLLSHRGNASVLSIHANPTCFYISGSFQDLEALGNVPRFGFTLPSFGIFTVKSLQITLYSPEMINKLVNNKESIDDASSIIVVDDTSSITSMQSSHYSDRGVNLAPIPFPLTSKGSGNHLSDNSMPYMRSSPMSSTSSANVTFLENSLDVAKSTMNLKSFCIPASKEEYPLLETYHCLNYKSEHFLDMKPSLFLITKLSGCEINLTSLVNLMIKTKPNLEGGFSMELIQNEDQTKMVIIYTTLGCEPYMRGIYGDTDSYLWFDVERDTLAKLFGHYPTNWMDSRSQNYEETEFFIQLYYSSTFTTTPV